MTEEEGRKEGERTGGGKGRRKAVCFFGLEREVDVEEEEGKAKEGRREEEGLSESRIGVKCIKCQVQNPWGCLLVQKLYFPYSFPLLTTFHYFIFYFCDVTHK